MRTPRRLLVALALALLAGCGGDPAAAPTAAPTPAAPTAAPTTGNPSPSATPTDAAATEGAMPQEAGTDAATGAEEGIVTLVGPDGTDLPFEVEVVADPATRRRGLMGRTDLAEGAGMLFLFPQETQGGFWMKDTLIPLHIAFIADDGDIVDVLEMEPCEADPCEVYVPDGPYRAALEVAAGALDGVDETWQAELPHDLPDPQ